MINISTANIRTISLSDAIAETGTIYYWSGLIRVDNYKDRVYITDLTNAMKPGRECASWCITSCDGVRVSMLGHGRLSALTLADLVLMLASNPALEIPGAEIYSQTEKGVRTWSPFAQVRPLQKLPAALTLRHVVNAIMAGQVTSACNEGDYTDDYAYDNAVDFNRGTLTVSGLLELCKELVEQPSGWHVFNFQQSVDGTCCIKLACHTFAYRTLTLNMGSRWDIPQELQAEAEAEKSRREEEARKRERQEEQARQEYAEKQAQGAEMIAALKEKFPVEDGAPVVTIDFSESSYIPDEGVCGLSIAAADALLRQLDEQFDGPGYDKTYVHIEYVRNRQGGSYDARYDIGDHDGGLLRHIVGYAESLEADLAAGEIDAFETITPASEIRELAGWLSQLLPQDPAQHPAENPAANPAQHPAEDIPQAPAGNVPQQSRRWHPAGVSIVDTSRQAPAARSRFLHASIPAGWKIIRGG